MSYSHLTMDERNVIYRMRFQGYPDAEIARCLGRHRSTIGRECKRNAIVEGRYDPGNAQTLGQQPQAGPSASAQDRPSPPDGLCRRASGGPLVARADRRTARRTVPRRIWRAFRSATRRSIAGSGAIAERTQQFRPCLRIARKPRRKPYGKPSRQGQILRQTIHRRTPERDQRADPPGRLGRRHRGRQRPQGSTSSPVWIGPAATWSHAKSAPAPPSRSPASSSRRSADCPPRNARV